MQFKDRQEAGQKLAAALANYKGKEVVVYALPRGGVAVGAEVAGALGAPLDAVIVQKIGHPFEPEYAVCAVAEDGHLLCSEEDRATLDPAWLKTAVKDALHEAARRREAYFGKRQRMSSSGKIAVVVDDGIATGLTMLLAIDELRRDHPKEIVVAVPVTPEETVEKIAERGATLVSLKTPRLYEGAVGAYYEKFPQLEDAEVVALLRRHTTP